MAAAILLASEEVVYGFTIKEGVFGTLQPVMQMSGDAVLVVWQSHGLGNPVITSIEDGQHAPNSKHYEGLAFDVRLNDVTKMDHEQLRREVLALAGDSGFDVIHEYHGTSRDHLHVEFDPK